jgi:hypothetical protein
MEAEGGVWDVVGDYAFFGSAGAALLFVVLYAFLSPWWRTEAGRNIMAVMGTLAFAMVYFGWAIARGGIPEGFWPIRAMIFLGMFTSIMWRVILFIREQVMVKKMRKEGTDHESKPLG